MAAAPALFPELRVRPTTMPTSAPSPRAVAAEDVKSWAARRGAVRDAWLSVLGPIPQRVPPEVEIVSREQFDDHERHSEAHGDRI